MWSSPSNAVTSSANCSVAYSTTPAGQLTIAYDAIINGVNDVGAGIGDVHSEDAANLADLGAVAGVLSAELMKANVTVAVRH
jgi:hypothetical protein